MHITVVTLDPALIEQLCRHGVVGRALRGPDLALDCVNPRDFAAGRHRSVDARPYGGGPGMLMKTAPLLLALEEAKRRVAAKTAGTSGAAKVIYMSPQGRPARQKDIERMAGLQGLVLLAGRYAGVDERVLATCVDEEISIGDFVVSSGDLPAMLLIDGIVRLRPGTLGSSESAGADSFSDGLLEGPQYTRPELAESGRVPEVLVSGDHSAVADWRRREALGRTWQRRPDLLRGRTLGQQDLARLADFVVEWKAQKEADS